MRALCALLPGFERRMLDSGDKGVRYACFIGRRNLAEDELSLPAGQDEIRIAPMPAGAKRGGLFQVILGVAMIAASFIPGLNVAMWSGTTATWSAGLASMGAAMALSGVAQLLTPQQRLLSVKDGPDNGASYNFNGPVNTTAQGNPVPVIYGEMIVGSATISAGIYSEDQAWRGPSRPEVGDGGKPALATRQRTHAGYMPVRPPRSADGAIALGPRSPPWPTA